MSEQPTQRTPFWEEMGLPAPGAHLTREEYDALPEVNIHIEWHDGVVVYPNWNEETMSPSPLSRHQRLVGRIYAALLKAIPNGEVLLAPMDLLLSGRTSQPDLFWVAEDGTCIDHGTRYEGPPALIVEVLSPSNTANDRVTKFDLYERSGVPEYWIVEPREDYIEVYTLNGGTYQRVGAYQPGQTFMSSALGKSVTVADLFSV